MKRKVNLEIGNCGAKTFNYPDVDEIKKFNIDQLHCLKSPNYTLRGDFYSDDYQYLEIKLKRCKGATCKK